MFLPDNLDQYDKEEKERKAAFERIEAWCMEMIPEDIREDAFVAVREMACGDPNCSPVDTAVTIMFERYAASFCDWINFAWLRSRISHFFHHWFSIFQQWSRRDIWRPNDGKRRYKRRSRTDFSSFRDIVQVEVWRRC